MKNLKYLLFLSTIAASQQVFSQQNFWRNTSSREIINKENIVQRTHIPTKSVKLDLAYDNFVNYLSSTNASEIKLKFPNAKGELNTYSIVENSSLSPELQKKYNEIKSYIGYNINNPS